MKRFLLVLSVLAIATVSAFAEYPPQGWTDDIREGITRAEDEGKMLLLNFTGSDWCSWCHKLEGEVFGTTEFQDWADDNLVRVFLDFPRSIELPEETVMQNQLMQQFFGVRGYPTIMVLDSDMTPLLQTGYRDGGAESYIRHLEGDVNLQVTSTEEFRNQFISVIEEYLGPVG